VAFGLFTGGSGTPIRRRAKCAAKVPWLIAGGAHTTALPREALDHGFDVAFAGEAEESVTRFVDFLEGRGDLESIPGAHFRGGSGPRRSSWRIG
jgi:radical SAM superfamily enzyme YgiQ (UPF0313 family)